MLSGAHTPPPAAAAAARGGGGGFGSLSSSVKDPRASFAGTGVGWSRRSRSCFSGAVGVADCCGLPGVISLHLLSYGKLRSLLFLFLFFFMFFIFLRVPVSECSRSAGCDSSRKAGESNRRGWSVCFPVGNVKNRDYLRDRLRRPVFETGMSFFDSGRLTTSVRSGEGRRDARSRSRFVWRVFRRRIFATGSSCRGDRLKLTFFKPEKITWNTYLFKIALRNPRLLSSEPSGQVSEYSASRATRSTLFPLNLDHFP